MSGQEQKERDSRPATVIVGAGMVGLTLAVALASAGLPVIVVEREDPALWADEAFDGRVSAIAAGSRRVFETLGLWAGMAAHGEAILDIRVTDAGSPVYLHFDHGELDQGPLGHIVENRIIRNALMAAVAKTPSIRMMAPRDIVATNRDGAGVEVTLAGGDTIATPLLVGADGRGSRVRQWAAINQTQWRYAQAAIVTTVVHTHPHQGVAEERFLAPGPFAILPMTDDEDGHHRSSIVWSEQADLVPALMDLGVADFNAELGRRFGDHLGDVEAAGPRWSYPLGLSLAEAYVADRLALIGDAAHGIHPIAGQGLNLGIRDVAALAEIIVDASRLGLDFGMKTVLEDYQSWRRFDNVALAGATDVLNRLFSTDFAPLRLARGLGLAAVNRFGPARRLFMREAMGLTGDLPRLTRGQML